MRPHAKTAAFFVLCAVLLMCAAPPVSGQAAVSKADYLAYARASADWTWQHYDELVDRWKKSFDPKYVFGYRAPGGFLEMAAIYAWLYEKEKKPEYAERAKKVLLTYGDFRTAFPEWAKKIRTDYEDSIPPLPDFFTVMRYIRAFDTLNRLGRLTAAERTAAETIITESMTYMLRTQEWGPMNRAILRAESLAWAVRALPRHKDIKVWEMQRRALGDDNWGNWEIEDATIYNGVWLYSLLGYADALGKTADLLKTPEMTITASTI